MAFDPLQLADPRSANYLKRYFTFQGPGYIWFSVPKQTATIPYFDLSFTGNDRFNLLINNKFPIPRIKQNGVYVGACANIIEHRKWSKDKIALPNGGPLPRKKRITSDDSTVEFEILLSDHPLITNYIYPVGAQGDGYQTFGGAIEDKEFSLTIIRVNDLKKPQIYYEVHHYHLGSIDGVDEITSPHAPTTYKLTWSPVAGRSIIDNCPLPPGQQGGAMWKVVINPSTGENSLYNSVDPGATNFGYMPWFNFDF